MQQHRYGAGEAYQNDSDDQDWRRREYHQPYQLSAGYGQYGLRDEQYGYGATNSEGAVCPHCGGSLAGPDKPDWRQDYRASSEYVPGDDAGSRYPASVHYDRDEGYGEFGNTEREHHSVFAFQAGRPAGVFSSEGEYRGRRGQGRGHHDDRDYAEWRREHMRRFDEDYDAWRKERNSSFAGNFNEWRRQRAASRQSSGAQHGKEGEAEEAASPDKEKGKSGAT